MGEDTTRDGNVINGPGAVDPGTDGDRASANRATIAETLEKDKAPSAPPTPPRSWRWVVLLCEFFKSEIVCEADCFEEDGLPCLRATDGTVVLRNIMISQPYIDKKTGQTWCDFLPYMPIKYALVNRDQPMAFDVKAFRAAMWATQRAINECKKILFPETAVAIDTSGNVKAAEAVQRALKGGPKDGAPLIGG